MHIGLHKTGTTFLQLEYLPTLNISLFNESRYWDRLGNKLIENDFIISSEGLSGLGWNELWKNGIENDFHWISSFNMAVMNLKFLIPDSNIIIVFRRHGDLLISMYKQYIQEGGILPFDKFYNENGVIRKEDLNFRNRIEMLETQFSNVYILSFEKFRKTGIGYFNSFFSQLNIEQCTPLESRKIRNESISGVKLEILRKSNKLYRHLPKRIKGIANYLYISPRRILQNRLSFWKPKDSQSLTNIAKSVNKEFESDWMFVESKVWDSKED